MFSQVFYEKPFTAAGMAFIAKQSKSQSAALYHSVWLALTAPSFKGGTSNMTEGSFWGSQRCEIHHRSLWHIQQHPCVCISEVCVFGDFSQRAGQPRVSPLGVWLFICLPRTADLKFLGPFRLPSMFSVSY